MGLPGGRNEPADASLTDTAIRETREETGVDLTQAELLGCLDPVPAQARGRRVALVIRPFVFALSETQPIGTSDEVDEALWCPLAPLYSGAWATTFKYEFDSHTLTLPAWNVGGRVVWGLTHAMLEMFARKLGIQPQRG
jgi:8-oxo-dGTP pyrophosphatase MutT (NUDIX family)